MTLLYKFIIWYIEKRHGGQWEIFDHGKLKYVHIYTDKMYEHIQKLLSEEWRKEHMNRNSSYWKSKSERAVRAKKHTEYCRLIYPTEIKNSIRDTKIYSTDDISDVEKVSTKNTTFILDNTTTDEAIKKHTEGTTTVLNFASYKNPGGMFIKGSMAQEESLCHTSYLYNVLKEFDDSYYSKNRKELNHSLYTNKALYSPGILFFGDYEKDDGSMNYQRVDVITCAAPNKSAAQKYSNISDDENKRILFDRCFFVLKIALLNKVDTLILGAFGCGVFGQDPYMVADIFTHLLVDEDEFKGAFNKVVFAIPKSTKYVTIDNYTAFEKVMTSRGII